MITFIRVDKIMRNFARISKNNVIQARHSGASFLQTVAYPKAAELDHYAQYVGDVDSVVLSLCPERPLYILCPEILAENANAFLRLFRGKTMFAVKCNPHPLVIRLLNQYGIRQFDAASLEEVQLVYEQAPNADIYFMHPVKAPAAIRDAYYKYGVRRFVLDSEDELLKILNATDCAADLELFVRIALPKNESAQVDFSVKFGAHKEEAIVLLKKTRAVSVKLGIAFHVGTQTMDASVYGRSVEYAASLISEAQVAVDVIDVGGGFPVTYPDCEPPDLSVFMDEIHNAIDENGLSHCELLAEPGRRMTAEASTLIVRVEQRRGDVLYINDGVYGGLYDAGPLINWRFGVRAVGARQNLNGADMTAFKFCGPTCDSIDMMRGPFMLPSDIAEGQWIEVEAMGAYSQGMRTNFNGFGGADLILLKRENN
jgi:ornithine decarboxylase